MFVAALLTSVSSPPAVPRMYQTVKLLYCFGIFITFALQFYVPAEILIPPAVARVSDSWKKPLDLLLRTLLVIFTCESKQNRKGGVFTNFIYCFKLSGKKKKNNLNSISKQPRKGSCLIKHGAALPSKRRILNGCSSSSSLQLDTAGHVNPP